MRSSHNRQIGLLQGFITAAQIDLSPPPLLPRPPPAPGPHALKNLRPPFTACTIYKIYLIN